MATSGGGQSPLAETVAAEGAVLSDWVDHKHFEELDSTQSFVETSHEDFDQTKVTVVSADFQTNGRGTGERIWHASRGRSLLATFYFRFPADCSNTFVNRNAPNVTKVLALSAISALSKVAEGLPGVDGSALRFGVKWPNDIVVSGRKIGGILARAVPFNGRLEGIILGIGINVNTPAADLAQIDRPVWPATSLYALTGEERLFDVADLRRRLIGEFASELPSYFAGGFSAFRQRVNDLEVLMGTKVRFRVHTTRELEGIFEGVDDDGLIVLRLPGGEVQSFPSGEIIPQQLS